MNHYYEKLFSYWPIALILAVIGVVVSSSLLVKESEDEKTRTVISPNMAGNPDLVQAGASTRLIQAQRIAKTAPQTALQIYSEIAPTSSEYPKARMAMASLLLVADRKAEAVEVLAHLSTSLPEDVTLHRALIELYFELEDYRAAVPHASAWVKLQSDNAAPYVVLAEAYAELQRYGDMVPPLEKALKIAPQSWDVNALLAYAFVESGDTAAAEQHVQWCLEQRPDDVISLRQKSILLRAAGENEKAVREIRKALAVDPDNVSCRIVECDLLLFQREAEAAFRLLSPLYNANKDDRKFLGAFLRAAAMSGRRELAKAAQARLVELIAEGDAQAQRSAAD